LPLATESTLWQDRARIVCGTALSVLALSALGSELLCYARGMSQPYGGHLISLPWGGSARLFVHANVGRTALGYGWTPNSPPVYHELGIVRGTVVDLREGTRGRQVLWSSRRGWFAVLSYAGWVNPVTPAVRIAGIRGVIVPSGLLPVGCTILGVVVMRGPLRRHRLWQSGHCRRCGYDIRGNPRGICSECGHAFRMSERRQ